MKRGLLIAAAAVFFSASVAGAVLFVLSLWKLEGVRMIAVPFRENGYDDFDSMVIRSDAELTQLITHIAAQEHSWSRDHRAEFIGALHGARVDFRREALVLLRHTEGSGSVKVRFSRPYLYSGTLTCRFETSVPIACTCDMAYYCMALVIDTEKVSNLELWVDNTKQKVWALQEMKK